MSFIKYAENRELSSGNGRGELSFHRAHVDGMPFRGSAPMLREAEFEDLTDVVWDGKVKMFDSSKPEDMLELQEIVDRVANGWYRCVLESRNWVADEKGGSKLMLFMAWAVPHKEVNRAKAGHLMRAGGI